ncbi:MAG: putative HTH-type transcriptional regulator [Pseudomonas citronellolis]|nr:MAG: putative HTH-type transcriptional regulator [Pseudomonas citronellolis]
MFIHLPLSLSSLVGRDELIRRLVALLPRQRLLTLAGPGGMGKTCVAIRVAEQLAGHYAGVAFVDLAAEAGDCDLDSAIAQALGPLSNAPELLLLDNCEHRADACAEAVERWLRLRPSLTILATSREPLRAEAEQVVRLPPLELPRRDELCLTQALACSAVQLFLLRAREVCDRFEMRPAQLGIIVRVCRALDGIPLAIEMAARQVPTLGLAGLPVLLERPLQLVMPGRRTAPARHQSLRATYDWSFDLLSGNELRCLNLLAGLGATFSLEGATLALRELRLCRGCVFDALRQLVEKSLLQVETDDLAVRYRLPYTAKACLLEREPLSRVGVAIPAA